jgi:mxaJ protein
MSSRFRKVALPALALIAAGASAAAMKRTLRVCADPDNLPYSNRAGQGFENKLAELLARELNAEVRYVWWPQRRGFVRNTLNAGDCDVVLGIPATLDLVLRTSPYYRSSYMFVTRAATPEIRSFDDPRLRQMTIGVQMIGDDGLNSPPAHALARRGIVTNVRGFMVYGGGSDTAGAPPLTSIMHAVETGEIDVAVVWGPVAGYFAARSATPLRLTPVSPQIELPFLPFVFDIAVGVRRGDSTRRAVIDAALERRRPQVERLLDSYGIPRVSATTTRAGS